MNFVNPKSLHTQRLLAYFKSLKGRVASIGKKVYYDDSTYLTTEQLDEMKKHLDDVKKELDTRPHIHGDNHVTQRTKAGKKIGKECTCASHPVEPHYCVYDIEIEDEKDWRTCTCCPFCEQGCADDI